jgi:hypothetical protein
MFEQRQERARDAHDPERVRLEHGAHVVAVELARWGAGSDDPRVIDQDVEPAADALHFSSCGLDALRVRDIELRSGGCVG